MKRIGIAVILAAALILSSCRKRVDDEASVTVIGERPALVEPDTGPVRTGDAVLLGAAAQGLVRFDAAGNIVPGLAERWNVSADGISYIFRIGQISWTDGRKVSAQDVVRLLRRQLREASRNPLKDTIGAIDEVEAMTDRVVDIELRGPRPNLLQLLAQPEFALLREGAGTGPFAVRAGTSGPVIELRRDIPGPDGDPARRERVALAAMSAPAAVAAFVAGRTDLVVGGDYRDLPIVQSVKLPRNTLRFDPVAGLFGLVPARAGGPLADPAFRALLDEAIDRQALVAALNVPDLTPRTTLLQPGLDGMPDPVAPAWTAADPARRHAALLATAADLFGRDKVKPVLRVAIPATPGGKIVIDRLRADWGPLGIRVLPADPGVPVDLRLIDLVAPSTSPAWFLRSFRCAVTPICDADADALLDSARDTPVPAQRAALFGEAEKRMEAASLFIALAAPIRWNLVSRDLPGFQENRFARHPLTGLTSRNGQDN